MVEKNKKKFPYYSIGDIKFRLIRDNFIKKEEYEKTMQILMEQKKFNPKEFYKKLFFDKNDLVNLDNLGHSIGLHSHSHSTLIEKLSYEEQKIEYEKCLSIISKIINKSEKDIKFMSHPCGSYNNDTLKILKDLGIELGFKQIMTIESEKGMQKINNSFLK